jgi:hypothetical protein
MVMNVANRVIMVLIIYFIASAPFASGLSGWGIIQARFKNCAAGT